MVARDIFSLTRYIKMIYLAETRVAACGGLLKPGQDVY